MRLVFGGVSGWVSHCVCVWLAAVGVVLASFFVMCAPAGAAACRNEALRGESSSTLLPDCRAYEMVTPAYQEGFPLQAADYSPDGEKLIVEGLSNIAGAPGAGEEALEPGLYSETRGGGGWQVASLNAPLSEFVGQQPIAREASSGLSLWIQHKPGQSAKTRDLYVRSASGVYSEVGPLDPHDTSNEEPSNVMEVQLNERDTPEAATSDYGHIVLKAYEAPDYWSFDNTKGPNSLYEYSGTGNAHPILVAINGPEKGNTNLIAECGAILGGGERGSAYNALSADGEAVFFTMEPCGGAPAEVYVRWHGSLVSPLPAETVDVSASECTGVSCGAESGKNFEGASEDGKRVYFTSTQKLMNGAVDGTATGNAAVEGESCEVAVTAGGGGGGCNLYEYEFLPEQKHILRLVAGGDEVLGVAGVAEDGEHIYFVAREEIPGAGENEYHAKPIREQPNLYVYDASTQETKFIATLVHSDESDWRRFFQKRSAEVSGDTGQYLLFVSENPGVTPDAVGGFPQLFEYDADKGELVRVTKGENGYNNNGNNAAPGISAESISSIANKQQGFRTSGNKSNVSVDGGTVVFVTASALSPRAFSAQNGSQQGCTSVYEFRTTGTISEGAVHLISDGRDVQANEGFACGAVFEGLDASGDNILFSTADPLVVGDVDGVVRSIYDARVEGGISPQPAQGEAGACSASSCVGLVSSGVLPSVLGSLSGPAEGNAVPAVVSPSSSGKSSTKKSSAGKSASRRKKSVVASHAKQERALGACVGVRGRARVLCVRAAKHRNGLRDGVRVGRSLVGGGR
jgi:hypothetical protein